MSNRFLLRDLTRKHHERLDEAVGEFVDEASYARYLTAIYSFRSGVEFALAYVSYPVEFGCWRPKSLAADILQDKRDLGLADEEPCTQVILPSSLSGLLGVLYVLEGSSLGARILLKRAAQLGYDENFAARNLAVQSADRESWGRFQQILENAHPFDAEEAAQAATQTFELATHAFRRMRHAELQD